MAIAGTLGQGKLLVLHPAFRGHPLAIPFAHGLQRIVARSLKAAGRPTNFTLVRTRVESVQWDGEGPPPMKVGDLNLAIADAWPDDQVATLVVRQFGCRWGLVLDMTATDATVTLATRLFEADDDGGARVIAEQAFDGGTGELPAFAFEIVREAAKRTGVRCAWSSWVEMFETTETLGGLYVLRGAGQCSAIEEGCTFDRDGFLIELGQMIEAAPGSGMAIALAADLLRAARQHGASPLHLVAWVKKARAMVGSPAAWAGLEDALS